MAYSNPTKANHYLGLVKNLLAEGSDSTDIDALIVVAQAEMLVEKSQRIQDDFKASCVAKVRLCDWTQLADAGLSAPDQVLWNTYRADLKALVAPVNEDEVQALVWPVMPS